MGDLAGGLAMGGASLLGGILTNQSNQSNALQQEQFQQQMSSTAYQRQVQDMRAAGLNPMFATGSGGASSPAGAMAVSQNPAAPAMSSAVQGIQALQNERKTDADVLNTAADTLLKGKQTQQSGAQTENIEADTKQKQAIGEIADQVKAVARKSGQGWKQIWDLIQGPNQSTAPKMSPNLP